MKRAPNPKVFLGLAVGTFVIGSGLVYFGYSSMTEQSDAVVKLRTDVKDTKEVQKTLDESTAKLAETSMKLKHLEKSVPDFAYVPTLLTDLESAGKANGIEVIGVRPMDKPVLKREGGDDHPDRKPYDELDIEVKGRGTYGDVMKFLAALQEFPKIVAARTVSLTPKASQTAVGDQLEVSIELRAYIFPQPAEKKSDSKSARREVRTHEG